MRIEHIALWTTDLERCKQFYSTYFGATPGSGYVNSTKGFESCFLSFKDGARIEAMKTTAFSPVIAESGAQRMGFTEPCAKSLALEGGDVERTVRSTVIRVRAVAQYIGARPQSAHRHTMLQSNWLTTIPLANSVAQYPVVLDAIAGPTRLLVNSLNPIRRLWAGIESTNAHGRVRR